MDWGTFKQVLLLMCVGAVVGFCCGAGCGAETWAAVGFQGVVGAAAGAGTMGVLALVAVINGGGRF